MNKPEMNIYTTQGIADYFNVTRRTVYNWIEGGNLKAAKIGKSWIITEESLREFLAIGTPPKESSEKDEAPED